MITRPAILGKSIPTTHGSGERLRTARKWWKLSTRAVAEELGEAGIDKDHRTISAYENEQIALSTEMLLALCWVYDASPLWILTDFGPERWSELPRWIERPEKYALQAAVEQFAREMGEAGRAAGVSEDVAEYWTEATRVLNGVDDDD